MIYTLYRPQRFEQVLGQGDLIGILKSQAKSKDYHHAYLFYGESGTGKTSTARILAMALNCESMNGIGEPCLTCQSCKAIAKGSSWDVQEIDGANCRGIDDIRELKSRAYLSPFGGGKKVYIIDEAHALTEPAWNALLKLLEEPPPHLVIIICSTQADKIPTTVKSRCQLYPFKKLKFEDIKGKLKRIAGDLSLEVDEKSLNFIAETSCGNMRSAENFLEQVYNLKGKGG